MLRRDLAEDVDYMMLLAHVIFAVRAGSQLVVMMEALTKTRLVDKSIH